MNSRIASLAAVTALSFVAVALIATPASLVALAAIPVAFLLNDYAAPRRNGYSVLTTDVLAAHRDQRLPLAA
jgi:hypothetical protein